MLPEPPDVFPWWDVAGAEEPRKVQEAKALHGDDVLDPAPTRPEPKRAVQHPRVTPTRAKRHQARHQYQHQGWAPAPVPRRSVAIPQNKERVLAITAVALFLLLAGAVLGVVGIVILALLAA